MRTKKTPRKRQLVETFEEPQIFSLPFSFHDSTLSPNDHLYMYLDDFQFDDDNILKNDDDVFNLVSENGIWKWKEGKTILNDMKWEESMYISFHLCFTKNLIALRRDHNGRLQLTLDITKMSFKKDQYGETISYCQSYIKNHALFADLYFSSMDISLSRRNVDIY